jgi:hypothetical protein
MYKFISSIRATWLTNLILLYLIRSTNHEISHCAIPSSLPLLPPSQAKIFFLGTILTHVFPTAWRTKFLIHMNIKWYSPRTHSCTCMQASSLPPPPPTPRFFREIWTSHRKAAKDSGLLGCDAVPLGDWFPTFQTIAAPSSARHKQLVENESATFVTNMRNHSPSH